MFRNQVTLIGNLGNDIELKSFASEKKMAKVPMATNHSYKNNDGEIIQETQWHNIIAWDKTAETMNNVLNKGDHLLIQGKLTYRSYEDAEGKKRIITEVVVNDFLRIHKANDSQSKPKKEIKEATT